MQNRVTYEFAVIRFVPQVEREEFLNIGVLVFSKREKYLGIKYTINKKRIEAFSQDADTNLIEEYLKGWELICEGGPKGGVIGEMELPDRFRWLAAAKSTVLQCSKTHPGLCIDPAFELQDIFNRYIL